MSRKQTYLVKCDNPRCKNYVESPRSGYQPPDWWHVGQYKNGQGTEGFDFCSPRCISLWAKERQAVDLPEGSYPCGICDHVSPTVQGLRTHERKAHGYIVPKEGAAT